MFPRELKIRSVYSKNHPKGTKISFSGYGNLISYEFYCGDKKVFRMKGANSKYLIYTLYLEALQNRLANSKQIIEENGDVTIITDIYDEKSVCIIPEFEFLMAPISHIIKSKDDDIVRYDALKAAADKDFKNLDKAILRDIISKLVEKGVSVIVFKVYLGYRFQDFKEKFWIK